MRISFDTFGPRPGEGGGFGLILSANGLDEEECRLGRLHPLLAQ